MAYQCNRTIILGYANALILWIAGGAFDLSRVQHYMDQLLTWALALEFVGLFLVYITLMVLLYRGITGNLRHVPAALSAFERKELEIARAVINGNFTQPPIYWLASSLLTFLE
jgi:membrane protein implicated in regulation of membrane protease activity